jgi:hypothetical protein
MPPLLPISLPANLTAPCAPLPPFEGKTSDDLVDSYLELTSYYKDCSTRHAGLIEAVK